MSESGRASAIAPGRPTLKICAGAFKSNLCLADAFPLLAQLLLHFATALRNRPPRHSVVGSYARRGHHTSRWVDGASADARASPGNQSPAGSPAAASTYQAGVFPSQRMSRGQQLARHVMPDHVGLQGMRRWQGQHIWHEGRSGSPSPSLQGGQAQASRARCNP